MNRLKTRGLLACVFAAAVTVGLVPPAAAAPAEPPTLAGAWAPFNRCPVDDPAMLAADGVDVAALCLASSATSGSMTIGETTVPTGRTDLQLGLLGDGASYSAVASEAAGIVADPVPVPGGLLRLMCPSDIPVLSRICERLADSRLNAVTATVLPAGAPSGFDLAAGLGTGRPIVTLPVKIRLQNPFLGQNCYLGSEEEPIVLRPANLTAPRATLVRFDPDGTVSPSGPMSSLELSGADQGDDMFAVPRANGCGAFGALDWAVNLQLGLPSPAGANSIVLDNPRTSSGGFYSPARYAPDQGRRLAEYWHAAAS